MAANGVWTPAGHARSLLSCIIHGIWHFCAIQLLSIWDTESCWQRNTDPYLFWHQPNTTDWQLQVHWHPDWDNAVMPEFLEQLAHNDCWIEVLKTSNLGKDNILGRWTSHILQPSFIFPFPSLRMFFFLVEIPELEQNNTTANYVYTFQANITGKFALLKEAMIAFLECTSFKAVSKCSDDVYKVLWTHEIG